MSKWWVAKNWSLLTLNSRSCLSWARVGWPTNSTSSTFNSNLVPQASDLGDNMFASVLSEKLGKRSITNYFFITLIIYKLLSRSFLLIIIWLYGFFYSTAFAKKAHLTSFAQFWFEFPSCSKQTVTTYLQSCRAIRTARLTGKQTVCYVTYLQRHRAKKNQIDCNE